MKHFFQKTAGIPIFIMVFVLIFLMIPETVSAFAPDTQPAGGDRVSLDDNIADILRGKNPEPEKAREICEDIENFEVPDFSAPDTSEPPDQSAGPGDVPPESSDPGIVSAEGAVSAESTINIKTDLTLTSNKTYTGTVVVYPTSDININHKILTVNGTLYIYGYIDVNGGMLKVNGNLVIANDSNGIDGLLAVNEGSVIVNRTSSTNGNFLNQGRLSMYMPSDKITVTNGDFIADGEDTDLYLYRGTIDINGDFAQLNDFDGKSFAPQEDLKVIIRGGTVSAPRVVFFVNPGPSYFSNFELAEGAVLSDDSIIVLKLSLSADTSITIPSAAVYFFGNLNGYDLTLYADHGSGYFTCPSASLNFGGGKVTVNGTSGFSMGSWVNMTNPADTFFANGDFITADRSAELTQGLLEINGDFWQMISADNDWDTFKPGPEFITRFDKPDTLVIFDSPSRSYFTNLEMAPDASFNNESLISLRVLLQQDIIDTPMNYPNLHLSGDLNGHTLTVGCNFTIAGTLNINGGRLLAKGDVYADGLLRMNKDADYVCVDGDYTVLSNNYNYNEITAGTLVFKGDFLAATDIFGDFGGYHSFTAGGTNLTILEGADKKVIFTNPYGSYFANVEIADGTTFTPDSVVSIREHLTKDCTFNIPKLYFAGNLNGHTVNVNGNLYMTWGMGIQNGNLTVSGDLTTNGNLSMGDAAGIVRVKGNYITSGNNYLELTKGTLYIEGNFHQLAPSTYYPVVNQHRTVFCGAGPQSIIFDAPSLIRLGIVEIANPKAAYTSLPCDKLIISCINLNGITATDGTLCPALEKDTLDYIMLLPKGITSTTLSVTTPNGNESVTMNGNAGPSMEIGYIPYEGNVPVQINVTIPDCALIKTYNVKVERLNADIASIGLTNCTLDKPFDPDTLDYSIELPSYTGSIGLAPVIGNPDSGFTMDGQSVASKTIVMNPGETKICVVHVTGQDGSTTKDYTFTIHRAPLIDDITITGGTLSPAFAFTVDSYTVDLPAADSDITISVGKSAGCDTLTMDGTEQDSMDVNLPLIGQSKTITITAKAAGSSVTHTYTVKVTRASLLTGLGQPANTTLSQSYTPTVLGYTLTVPSSMAEVTLHPTVSGYCDEIAFKLGDGEFISAEQVAVDPMIGETIPVSIRVRDTADGIEQIYTIDVLRRPIVTNITSQEFPGSFVFSPTVLSYEMTVPANVGSLRFSVTGAHNSTPSYSIGAGEIKTFNISVDSADHLISITYSIVVTCVPKPLDSITASYGSTIKTFDAKSKNYNVNIDAITKTVTIEVDKNDHCSKLEINGAESESGSEIVSPPIGSTPYLIKATDVDTGVITTYTVTIERRPLLNNITASVGTLYPAFDPEIDHYVLIMPLNKDEVTISPTRSSYCNSYLSGTVVTVPKNVYKQVKFTASSNNGVSSDYFIDIYNIQPVSGLQLTSGTLSPSYNPGVQNYTITLPATISSTTVTPVLTETAQSITIDGEDVNSKTYTLNTVGETASSVISVVAIDNTVRTYNLTVKRSPLITKIKTNISKYPVSPVFSPITARYTIDVPATVPQICITPVKASSGVRSMTINGRSVSYIYLKPAIGGSATANIVATATDGVTKSEYTVTVRRAPLVTDIDVSSGTLMFSPTALTYTVDVPADTPSVTVTAAQAASGVRYMKINNVLQSSVVLTPAVGGTAKATVTALATDSKTKITYTVIVRRAPVISGISPDTGTMSPAFSATAASYTINLPSTVSSCTLTPVKGVDCAVLLINGVPQDSLTVNPLIGESIPVVIEGRTALGTAVTYNVTVKRAALITKIRSSSSRYPLSPVFSPTSMDYTIDLPATTGYITLYVTKASSGVKALTINGRRASYVTLRPAIGGSATAAVVATAADGVTKSEYTVTVRRAPLVTDIDVSSGTLMFSPTALTYTVDVPADTPSVTVTAAQAASGVRYMKINNVLQSSVVLTPAVGGTAKATVTALATDSKTKITYTVIVRRAPVISGISPDTGTMSPAFSATAASYTINLPSTVSSCTLTPVKGVDCAVLLINGVPQDSLTVNPLIGESIPVVIEGRTALGTAVTYNVTVKRAALITKIRSSSSRYPLSPVFSPTSMDYTIDLPATTSYVTVYVTKASSGVKALTINGRSASSYTARPAVGGTEVIVVNAVASDGVTSVTYTITVKRAS